MRINLPIYLHTHTTKLTTLRSKHSQSALEYMMTYGWAILIIVIVAAGLYSLGIFSPTNSAGTTVTGFSSLGSVQAACSGNQGLLITLGNSAGAQMNITKINISSDSGYSNTLNTNILLTPNQENTIFLSSTSLCSSGSSYSLKVSVTYTEPGQTFQGPYFSSGTVQGTPSNSISFSVQNMVVLGLSHKEQLNITNSQSSATPAPFQQMINLSAANFTSYGAPNLQNVIFYYPNGQVIPSWLESNGSKSSTFSIFWLKLNGGLGSSSKQTIYMGFAPTTSNLFNTNNIGEAPQLSVAYGQYDDGAEIFVDYWNFNSNSISSLNSSWNYGAGGINYMCDNGAVPYAISNRVAVNNKLSLNVNSTSSDVGLVSVIGFTPPVIFDTDIISANGSVGPSGVAESNGNSISSAQYMYSWGSYPSAGWSYDFVKGSIATGYGGYTAGTVLRHGIAGIAWISGNSEVLYTNYTAASFSETALAAPTLVYPAIGLGSCDPSSYINIQWARVRAYPPNGVMPSVSFGSIQ